MSKVDESPTKLSKGQKKRANKQKAKKSKEAAQFVQEHLGYTPETAPLTESESPALSETEDETPVVVATGHGPTPTTPTDTAAEKPEALTTEPIVTGPEAEVVEPVVTTQVAAVEEAPTEEQLESRRKEALESLRASPKAYMSGSDRRKQSINDAAALNKAYLAKPEAREVGKLSEVVEALEACVADIQVFLRLKPRFDSLDSLTAGFAVVKGERAAIAEALKAIKALPSLEALKQVAGLERRVHAVAMGEADAAVDESAAKVTTAEQDHKTAKEKLAAMRYDKNRVLNAESFIWANKTAAELKKGATLPPMAKEILGLKTEYDRQVAAMEKATKDKTSAEKEVKDRKAERAVLGTAEEARLDTLDPARAPYLKARQATAARIEEVETKAKLTGEPDPGFSASLKQIDDGLDEDLDHGRAAKGLEALDPAVDEEGKRLDALISGQAVALLAAKTASGLALKILDTQGQADLKGRLAEAQEPATYAGAIVALNGFVKDADELRAAREAQRDDLSTRLNATLARSQAAVAVAPRMKDPQTKVADVKHKQLRDSIGLLSEEVQQLYNDRLYAEGLAAVGKLEKLLGDEELHRGAYKDKQAKTYEDAIRYNGDALRGVKKNLDAVKSSTKYAEMGQYNVGLKARFDDVLDRITAALKDGWVEELNELEIETRGFYEKEIKNWKRPATQDEIEEADRQFLSRFDNQLKSALDGETCFRGRKDGGRVAMTVPAGFWDDIYASHHGKDVNKTVKGLVKDVEKIRSYVTRTSNSINGFDVSYHIWENGDGGWVDTLVTVLVLHIHYH